MSLRPDSIPDPTACRANKNDYLFFDCINHIHEVSVPLTSFNQIKENILPTIIITHEQLTFMGLTRHALVKL